MNTRRPRLPSIPFAAYQPPDVLPTAPERVADKIEADKGQEVFAQTFALPSKGTGGPGEVLSVYKTAQAWRACDVYVQPTPPKGGFTSQGVLSVFIYALTQGVRTLVASGRYWIAAGAGPFAPRWIAGIRSVAQRFEVVCLYTQSGLAPAVVGAFDVAVVASNEAVDVPEDLGAELCGSVYLQGGVATGLGVNIAGVQIPTALELLSVRAVNGAAAARYLQLHDTALTIPAFGAVPLMTWGLGATVGQGLGETKVRYRAKNRIQLVISSTMNTFTSQVDGSVSAIVR